MLRIVALKQFLKEFNEFPLTAREDFHSLFEEFIEGNLLGRSSLKIFKINRSLKIYEFRYKDRLGNWRVIATIMKGDSFILVYAFHKKSQALLEKDKSIIIARIKGLKL